jgi:predicted transcriptional regulator
MKWALARREEEIRKLTREVKYVNLELENKEDLYTRIFRGNSMSRDKKCKDREDKEGALDEKCKDFVCRRSQTSDIKLLLKAYNGGKS